MRANLPQFIPACSSTFVIRLLPDLGRMATAIEASNEHQMPFVIDGLETKFDVAHILSYPTSRDRSELRPIAIDSYTTLFRGLQSVQMHSIELKHQRPDHGVNFDHFIFRLSTSANRIRITLAPVLARFLAAVAENLSPERPTLFAKTCRIVQRPPTPR